MATTIVQLDRSAQLSADILQALALQEAATNLMRTAIQNCNAMIDGADYSMLSTEGGFPTGAEQAAFTLLNAAYVAMAASAIETAVGRVIEA